VAPSISNDTLSIRHPKVETGVVGIARRRVGRDRCQVYQCWWRICREINVFFFRFEYHMLYVLYLFVTCLLSPIIQSFLHSTRWHPNSFTNIKLLDLGGGGWHIWSFVFKDFTKIFSLATNCVYLKHTNYFATHVTSV
jgi:hypothetical protein